MLKSQVQWLRNLNLHRDPDAIWKIAHIDLLKWPRALPKKHQDRFGAGKGVSISNLCGKSAISRRTFPCQETRYVEIVSMYGGIGFTCKFDIDTATVYAVSNVT